MSETGKAGALCVRCARGLRREIVKAIGRSRPFGVRLRQTAFLRGSGRLYLWLDAAELLIDDTLSAQAGPWFAKSPPLPARPEWWVLARDNETETALVGDHAGGVSVVTSEVLERVPLGWATEARRIGTRANTLMLARPDGDPLFDRMDFHHWHDGRFDVWCGFAQGEWLVRETVNPPPAPPPLPARR